MTKPKIVFWQYWSGSEKKPLEDLVAKFNAEEHDFKVEMLSVSMPHKKILMAIAAGVPPDLIHIDGDMAVDLGLRGGLLDLNPGLEARGLKSEAFEKYIPVYIDMLNIEGKQYAMPLMPTCDAMHVNKKLLDKYDLEIPETLDDIVAIFDRMLEARSSKLERENFQSPTSNFELDEVAWLPSWPPWTGKFIVTLFGGNWDKANSAENVAAWTWVQNNFASKISKDKLAAFTEGFHAYQSPDNPFYSGRIAIENSGVWEYKLAGIFAPKIEVVVAPFPSVIARSETTKQSNAKDWIASPAARNDSMTQVAVDALAIPRGSRHPQQAQEFIKWLHQQENLEYLALGQGKFTPLKNHSADFFTKHENPYIKVFIDLANSPGANYFPQVAYASRYKREIKEAYLKVLRMEASPQEVLDELQTRYHPVSATI